MQATPLDGIRNAAPVDPSPRAAGLTAALVQLAAQAGTTQAGAAESAGAPEALPSPLTQALQQAAAVQGGLGALFADLAAVAQAGGLPPALQTAAAQVLAAELPLDPPPSAQDLQQAVARSGLFLEASLAQTGAAPADDLKAALLTLQAALQDAGAEPEAARGAPPPPYLDAVPTAQAEAVSTLALDLPWPALLGRLAGQTRAALGRQVLMQAASRRTGPHGAPREGRSWLFELPLETARGSAVAQFEIDADEERAGGQAHLRNWRTQFSLDIAPTGPVHVRIALRGGVARVTLWAEADHTHARLFKHREELSAALADEGLSPQVAVLPGAPAPPEPPPPGHFVAARA